MMLAIPPPMSATVAFGGGPTSFAIGVSAMPDEGSRIKAA